MISIGALNYIQCRYTQTQQQSYHYYWLGWHYRWISGMHKYTKSHLGSANVNILNWSHTKHTRETHSMAKWYAFSEHKNLALWCQKRYCDSYFRSYIDSLSLYRSHYRCLFHTASLTYRFSVNCMSFPRVCFIFDSAQNMLQ